MKLFKKLAVVLIVALLGVGVADAQFRFGVKAGLNVNNLHLNDPAKMFSDDNGVGWTAGLMTEFKVPVIGLCFDASLMYTRMNADVYYFPPQEDAGEQAIKNKNFLNIPINIKYKFSLPVVGKFLAPYIYTGPDIAFKLDKNTIQDFKTKTCQVAWNVGLGVELVNHLQLQASYGFGINNIADHWVNAVDEKVKNNYWTVTLGYLF